MFLYIITLAPSILWGDGAQYQRLANGFKIDNIPRGHVIYTYLIKITNIFPFYNPAIKANFFSAFWASLTLTIIFLILFLISSNEFSSILGVIIFTFSHTFWLHSVIAEVHTLQLFFIAFSIYLLILWSKSKGNNKLLMFSFLSIGISLCNHILSIAIILAMLYLVIKKTLDYKTDLIIALTGLIPGIIILILFETNSESVFTILADIFTVKNLLQIVGKNMFMFMILLCYQFSIFILFCFMGIKLLFEKDKTILYFFIFIIFFNVLEVILLPIHDQYVMFLPSFLIFLIFITIGLNYITFKCNLLIRICLIILAIFLPIYIYIITPKFLKRHNINIAKIRSLENRDNFSYFLYPPKNGYWGAYNFAKETLRNLPLNSIIIADFTIAQPLLYIQEVEKYRNDIQINGICFENSFIQHLGEKLNSHQIFLADYNDYYPIEEIRKYFTIIPYESIYKLGKLNVNK
jgi:hypothetical protein